MKLINNDVQFNEEKEKINKIAKEESSNEATITALLKLNKLAFAEIEVLKSKVTALEGGA